MKLKHLTTLLFLTFISFGANAGTDRIDAEGGHRPIKQALTPMQIWMRLTELRHREIHEAVSAKVAHIRDSKQRQKESSRLRAEMVIFKDSPNLFFASADYSLLKQKIGSELSAFFDNYSHDPQDRTVSDAANSIVKLYVEMSTKGGHKLLSEQTEENFRELVFHLINPRKSDSDCEGQLND